MALSAAHSLRRLKTRGQSDTAVSATNKRPRVSSAGEPQRKKAEAMGTPSSALDRSSALLYGVEPLLHAPTEGATLEVEDEGGGGGGRATPEKNVSAEIAAIAAKNEQLQDSVSSLKRRFSLREEETHQLLLGLGALNAVANELAALQKDYQERSMKNAALVQESLVQISNCSAQVDTLKRCRGLTATQLQTFRHKCTQEMNRLVSRLGDLAESAFQEPETFDGDDVSCSARRRNENRLQVERLKEEVCGYRAQFADDQSVATSCTAGPSQQDTSDRINLALTQLDELHAEMFQLKQSLVRENQSFRRHLEDLVSRQMAHIRDVQDNESERVHEEMDEIRSGMCGILKDIHRLKERTKYLVPNMARVEPRLARSNPNGALPLQSRPVGLSSGDQNEGRWMSTPQPANPQSTGYSMSMASRQCQDKLPHFEHGFGDDCYCPGVLPSQMEAQYPLPGHPRNPRSSKSSQDEDNWRVEDVPITDQHTAQPCQSPHYSSRSSSLSDRLSFFGEEHVVPNDEPSAQQFEQQLLEQHRLFWIGEGAG